MSDHRAVIAEQTGLALHGGTFQEQLQKVREQERRSGEWLKHFITESDQTFLVCYFTPRPNKPDRIDAGWYNGKMLGSGGAAGRIVAPAHTPTLAGVSGVYFVPNPVRPKAVKSPILGNFGRVSSTVRDEDIAERRFILLDFDANRPTTTNATDAEKAAAAELEAHTREWLTTRGWPAPIVVDSGNGYQDSYRVEPAVGADVAEFLRRIAAHLRHPAAHIDPAVANPARLFKAPGGIARKGPATDERPHRRAKLLSAPPPNAPVVSAGLFAATLAELPAVEGKHASEGRSARVVVPVQADLSNGTPYGRTALEAEVAEVSSTPDGSRNVTLNHAAFKLGQLVGGNQLTEAETRAALIEAAVRVGLGDNEAAKTITSGLEAGMKSPRKPQPTGYETAGIESPLRPAARAVGGPATASTPSADEYLNEAEDDPHKLARSFLAGYVSDGRRTLAYWQGEFHAWDGCRYVTHKDVKFRPLVNRAVRRELVATYKTNRKAWEGDGRTGEPPRVVKLPTSLVSSVLEALQGMALVDADAAPCWLDGVAGPDPRELVATRNGLIHLPRYAADPAAGLTPNTPAYLNFNAAGFAVDPLSPTPAAWLAFLDTLWPGDPDSVSLLQEWFGYLLTPDTRLQKLLWLKGDPRSGKGTICSVIRALVGDAACASPALWKFGKSQFALSQLVGKSVALVEDCRLTKNIDTTLIVENLLTITGEGCSDVEKKGQDNYSTRLKSRFVIASNDPPTVLLDEQGAFHSRLCLLETKASFLGREDTTLLDRLLTELPGIFNWAIEGWRRLRDRQRFTEPKSSARAKQKLADAENPVRRFVRERCEVGAGESVPKATAYAAFGAWCPEQGLPGLTRNGFARKLNAAVTGIGEAQLTINGGRQWHYTGLSLKKADLYDDEPLLPHELGGPVPSGSLDASTDPASADAPAVDAPPPAAGLRLPVTGPFAPARPPEPHRDDPDRDDRRPARPAQPAPRRLGGPPGRAPPAGVRRLVRRPHAGHRR
jgi:putative DNA primase/helicase